MDSIQDEIIEEFSVFDDWLDKYDYLIDLSETLPAIAPEHRTERYLIEGCQSRVWVDAKLEDGRVYYAADSDAIITKGIIALLIRVLNGRTPQEISRYELYYHRPDAIGLAAQPRPRGPLTAWRWSTDAVVPLTFRPKAIHNSGEFTIRSCHLTNLSRE